MVKQRLVPLFRNLILLCCLGFCATANSSTQCSHLEQRLATQKLELESLQLQNERLSQLISGQLSDDFNLAQAFNFDLDVPNRSQNTLDELEQEINNLPNTVIAPASLKNCGEATSHWVTQQKQIHSLQKVILQSQLRLFKRDVAVRRALVREANRWQRLFELEAETKTWAESYPNNTTAAILVDQIHDWIEDWRNSTRIWFGQVQITQQTSPTDNTWIHALTIPHPDRAIAWDSPGLESILDYPENKTIWQQQLKKAHLSLIRVSQRWQNHQIWQQGWRMFFQSLTQPDIVIPQLKIELISAPLNLIDSISQPLIHAYRYAIKQDKKGELLSSWFLQSLMLIAAMSAFLKLAGLAPGYLAGLQQKLFTWFNHKIIIQVSSSLLWLLKPNTPWLVVLIGTQVIADLLHDDWFILKSIAPLGALYSLFRAVRVILEWMLSRTFTRSSQFVSSQIARQQASDVHRVAWVLVITCLTWLFVRGTGGGYLLFVVSLIALALTWYSGLWLLWRYKDASARFLLYCIGNKQSDKIESAQRWWLVMIWPLLFVLAHTVDVIRHFHEKLLVFDAYRAFAIKLLRIRMAAEAKEEVVEDDQDLPDENYNDWMLRELDTSRFKPEKMESILECIQLWQQEKSTDNVQLIIGDQGTGKSSLIEHLCESWQETPIRVLDVPAKTTQPEQLHQLVAQHFQLTDMASIADLVNQEEHLEQQIVVVDNAHNLFLSEVGQLGGFHTLNQYLNARLSKIFWVVVIYSPSWYYLRRVYERELHFNNIYTMPRWSPGDIRKLILSRHQCSRRHIQYNELLLSASAGSESSSVRAADSRVFNILWEQSNGVPMVALHLWLAAARSKGRVVEIGVPEKPGAAPLKNLRDELCFIFAAIITHESLNSEEICMVTHYPDPIVRHSLKQGMKMGLLKRDEQRRYRIHPVWQGTLNSFLASKNMILNG